jgi:DNA (cytosine-5)-methyltransferase 1
MISIASLFAGAGALDLAFQSVGGFETVSSFDVQPEFCDTVLRNQESSLLRTWPVTVADVRQVNPADIRAVSKGSVLGLIGGPPCESFSSMGRRRGHADPRGTLVFTFANLAVASNVDFFVMENVPALISANGGAPFVELLEEFERGGFTVTHATLCAADYGAATVRKRVFIVGIRGHRFRFPTPTHGVGTDKSWRTVREALEGLPAPATSAPGHPQAHVLVRHSEKVRARFNALPPGSYDNVRKRSRLSWNKPSPSLVAGDLRGIRSHIHPEHPRELTSRESARIQGFPDEFVFAGTPAAIGKQVANAVPIPLGMAIAKALRTQLQGEPQ